MEVYPRPETVEGKKKIVSKYVVIIHVFGDNTLSFWFMCSITICNLRTMAHLYNIWLQSLIVHFHYLYYQVNTLLVNYLKDS